MDVVEDEASFLRALVKTSRQKTTAVKWTDRDGTSRQTMLNAAELARLTLIAGKQRISLAEVLRQAAFVPVAKVSAPTEK